jgi:hypothetical protein
VRIAMFDNSTKHTKMRAGDNRVEKEEIFMMSAKLHKVCKLLIEEPLGTEGSFSEQKQLSEAVEHQVNTENLLKFVCIEGQSVDYYQRKFRPRKRLGLFLVDVTDEYD